MKHNSFLFLGMGMGYTHKTDNYSRMFISFDGVHTNNVESLWAHCKQIFKRTNGGKRELIPSYLDEFTWRRMRSVDNVLGDILQAISIEYPLL